MNAPDIGMHKNWKRVRVSLDTDSFQDLQELQEWLRAANYSEVVRRAIKVTHVREEYLREKGQQQ